MPVQRSEAAAPLVVFTDLDGTLLDARTYEVGEAREALAALAARSVPVIFCSSKTAAEQRPLRAALGLGRMPFIVENGSAVLVPEAAGLPVDDWPRGIAGERVRVLGLPAGEVRAGLARAAAVAGLRVTGYADLTATEVAARTGLGPAAAQRARQREFSETLVDELPAEAWAALERALAAEGLCARHGGRFRTVTGASADKGRAAAVIAGLFDAVAGRSVETAGLGDSVNDESLLAAVDRAYWIGAGASRWMPPARAGQRCIAAAGPAGWREAIFDLLAPASRG
jgi:mannosyl-3-phosphoglycerate phosphatase family protein